MLKGIRTAVRRGHKNRSCMLNAKRVVRPNRLPGHGPGLNFRCAIFPDLPRVLETKICSQIIITVAW